MDSLLGLLSEYQIELIGGMAILVAGALVYRFFSRLIRNIRLRMRFKRGARGEERARRFLEKNGFRILGAQSEIEPRMKVDGKDIKFSIKADFLVSKKGRRGVVEVKTGQKAPDPKSSATRRQILEYSTYYNVDDVYLFDAEAGRLHEIQFNGGSLSLMSRGGAGGLGFWGGLLMGAGGAGFVGWMVR